MSCAHHAHGRGVSSQDSHPWAEHQPHHALRHRLGALRDTLRSDGLSTQRLTWDCGSRSIQALNVMWRLSGRVWLFRNDTELNEINIL